MSSFSRFPASWLASPTLSVALKALALSLLVGLGSAAPGAGQVRGTLRAIDGDGNPVSNFPQSGGGLSASVIKGTRRTATGNLGIFDGEGTIVVPDPPGRKTGYGTFIIRSTTPTPVRDPRNTAGPNPRKSARPSLVPGPRSTGRWTYILDESNPAVRALEPGQSLREFVEINVDFNGDETIAGTVDITIYGSPGAETDRIGDITDRDRLPVEQPPFRGRSSLQFPPFEGGGFPRSSKVSGLTGSVTKGSAEHSCTSPRPPREPRCQGSNYSTGGQIIDSNNPKGGPDTFVVQKNTQGKYGRFTIDATGNWVYQLENDYPTTVALTEEAIDSFRVYRLSRVYGQTVPREGVNSQRAEYLEYQVEVTILPGSPPGRIVGTLAGSVTEDAPGRGGEASGALGVHNAPATFSQDGPGPIYGWFRLYNDRGQWRWTYTLDNSRAVTNRLNVVQDPEETAKETIGIRASNGATANIVITINGSDDPVVIGGTLAGTVTEDATDMKGVVVDTVQGEIIISDDDRSTLREETFRGRYGTLRTWGASPPGWEYTLDNDRPRTNALLDGERVSDDFAITVVTPNKGVTRGSVNITVVGSDDRAAISGTFTGEVTEDDPAKSSATGRVILTNDADASPLPTVTEETTSSKYGRFTVDPNGEWRYDLDNSLDAVQALGFGTTKLDTFEIGFSDPDIAPVPVVITVKGAREVIVGGQLRGVVIEVGGMATGAATRTDGGTFTAQTDTLGSYGTFAIQSDGEWRYTLDDDEAAIDALKRGERGERVTDEFDIREPGAGSKEIVIGKVVITITGFLISEPLSTISGNLTGEVTEDDPAASSATGKVVSVTADGDPLKIDPQLDPMLDLEIDKVSGTYGTFTIGDSGVWTYELDNGDPNVNALDEGQTQTDSFVIKASDGSQATVTITIIGADDVSTIGGALEGYVIATRNDPTKSPRVTGVVSVSDPDTSPTVVAQTDVSGTYGTFTIEANGSWAYDLDNSHPDIAALRFEQRATDPFPISTSDGTSGTVTITIAGASSPSTISGTMTGTVTEGDGPAPSARGRVREAAAGSAEKPIESGISFASQDYTQGTYGRFSLESDGTWLYVLDNSDPDTVALTEGQRGTDSFAVKIAEGKDVRVNYFCPLPPLNTLPERGCFAEGQDAQEEAFIVTITIIGADVGTVDPPVDPIEPVDPIGPVDPIQKPISTYLQARSGALLGKQPGLIPFLKEPQPRSRTEGGISMQVVQDDSLAFEGSFVRDTSWGEVSGLRSGLDDNLESNDRDYLFATLGFHGQISATTLAGLMVQFDQGDEDLRASQGTVNGRGWRFGPYFVARDQRGALYVESRLLYGRSSNDIRFSAAEDSALRRGAFDTTSWLASIRLEGEMDLDYGNRVIRLIPHVDSSWVRDEVKAFTDDEGIKVPGQVVHFGEVKLGSDIEIPLRFGRREAMFTTGLSLVSTRESARIEGRSQAQQSVSDTHGRAELGLDYQLNNRIQLEFGGIYNDSDKGGSSSVSLGIRSRF